MTKIGYWQRNVKRNQEIDAGFIDGSEDGGGIYIQEK